MDKQKDRPGGGLSLHLLYAAYDKCGGNGLTLLIRGAAFRAIVQRH
jgi:hypothetical protein